MKTQPGVNMASETLFSVDMPHCHKQSGPCAGSAPKHNHSYTEMMYFRAGNEISEWFAWMREGPAQAQKDIDVCLTSVGKSWMQSPTECFLFCHAPQITDISPGWKQCIFLSDGASWYGDRFPCSPSNLFLPKASTLCSIFIIFSLSLKIFIAFIT